ncbi:hypothetical protein A2766_02630 [Candidatus Kaiserbacteria bacterium RIFCSPHIGHO2_01_FULL_58_22]|nr:MAG: hypothetical protein A2766_02630 [Candidatus Kaiserbacteria bacterium RIFCSPHIGHO2_01_FULL_58_22]
MGGTIFALRFVLAGITAAIGHLIFWNGYIPEYVGWVIGGVQTSPMLSSALAAVVLTAVNGWSATVRPHGPGSGKWTRIAISGTLIQAYPLALAFWLWTQGRLVPPFFEVAAVLTVVIAADIWNWIMPHLRPGPTNDRPPARVPTP